MPDCWNTLRQTRLGLRVDDAHVDNGLDSDLTCPGWLDVTPPGRGGNIKNFGLFSFGLTLLCESIALMIRLQRSDRRTSNEQPIILGGDRLREIAAVGVDSRGKQLLDGRR